MAVGVGDPPGRAPGELRFELSLAFLYAFREVEVEGARWGSDGECGANALLYAGHSFESP